MSAKGNAVTSDKHARSDLRRIDGLGPKSAKALSELGIGSCAELVLYLTQQSAGELSESLAQQGVKVAAKKIENDDWLGQASKQAVQANGEPATSKEDSWVAEEGDKAPNRRSSLPDEVRFGVSFWRENGRWKVTTYDERLPIKYDKEHGTDPAEWANWILRQMAQDPELGFVPTEGGAAPELEIEILDVQPSEVERFEKLAVELSFEVSGSAADTLAATRIPFWIQVHTVALDSGAMDLVASIQEELEPQVFTYKKKLEFPIPKVGRYELNSLVLLLPPTARMALYQGPTLTVIP